MKKERITGRMNDGTAFVHSETGNEGVGHFTTQRRLPEIISKLADLEDKIENGELVEVKHGRWKMQNFIIFDSEKVGYRCSECNTTWDANTRYCPYCGAKMDRKGD